MYCICKYCTHHHLFITTDLDHKRNSVPPTTTTRKLSSGELLLAYAKAVHEYECCDKWCLNNLSRDFVTKAIISIEGIVQTMTKKEKKQFVR